MTKTTTNQRFSKKLVGIFSLASLGSLMALPGLAQVNPRPSIFNEPPYSRSGGGVTRPNLPTLPQRAPASAPTSPVANLSDPNFMIKAAQDNLAEIQMGQLAQQRGATDMVKQYGQMMVREHTQANRELAQLATSKGVTLPKDMGAENRAIYNRLSGLSGTAFDRAYMAAMVTSHMKDVSLFRSKATQAQSPELKTWASSKLPSLVEHLQMARSAVARQTTPNQIPMGQ